MATPRWNARRRLELLRQRLDSEWAEAEADVRDIEAAELVHVIVRKWGRAFELVLVPRDSTMHIEVRPMVSRVGTEYYEHVRMITCWLNRWKLGHSVTARIAAVPPGIEPYVCGVEDTFMHLDMTFEVPLSFDLGVPTYVFFRE